MSEVKWTPGPWKTQPCSNGGLILIRGEYGQHQQSHLQVYPVEDAHLIAAAPDEDAALLGLFNVAKEAIAAYGECQEDEMPGWLVDLIEAVKVARAALAKARGEA